MAFTLLCRIHEPQLPDLLPSSLEIELGVGLQIFPVREVLRERMACWERKWQYALEWNVLSKGLRLSACYQLAKAKTYHQIVP